MCSFVKFSNGQKRASGMASIELRHVTKRYGSAVLAVSDISLDIKDGEFVILLGPSGCGKSTALRMIAGLESVTSGEVHIGGRCVNEVAPRDRNIAVVFQNYALYPHMTVAENLAFGLKMHRRPNAEIEAQVKRVAKLLGIEPLLARRPAALSGGQRQRVALGRALVRNPVAFLLDEPLSNLDARLRADMRLALVKLHRQLGTTIVHVTHDQVEAMTMGERICIMKDGRLIQSGRPLEVYRDPINTFVAGFLASPPMNLIEARVVAANGSSMMIEAGTIRLPMPQPYVENCRSRIGSPIILGIRPEDLHEKQPDPAWQPVEGEVVALEALGAEVILVLAVQGLARKELSARLDRHYRATVGSLQRLYVDVSEIRLFDPETTIAVPRGA
jgi:multiple sugar transport system ATP-binding protein